MRKRINKEEKYKYLEFIQNIITRNNANSFQIKVIATTVYSAILAVYITVQNKNILIVTGIVILICWYLDIIYLGQEREFRNLYEDAIKDNVKMFSMNIKNYKLSFWGYIEVAFSKTMWPLYIGMLLISLIIYLNWR